MKRVHAISILLLTSALPVAAAAQEAAPTEVGQATFISAEGQEIGTATLAGTPSGLLVRLDVTGLPPDSWHGFHIHENGECDAAGGFQSAGGHFTIAGTDHGFLVDEAPHAGDMPNQYVGSDGTLTAELLNTFVFLGGPSGNLSGRALVLHSGPDDYQSQPSGDSGDRIACAVIE